MAIKALGILFLLVSSLAPASAFEAAKNTEERRVIGKELIRTLWRIAVAPKPGEVVMVSFKAETVNLKDDRVIESKEVVQIICNPPEVYAAEIGFTQKLKGGPVVFGGPHDMRIFGLGQDVDLPGVFLKGERGGWSGQQAVHRQFQFTNHLGEPTLMFRYRFDMKTVPFEKAKAIASEQKIHLPEIEAGKMCSFVLQPSEATARVFRD